MAAAAAVALAAVLAWAAVAKARRRPVVVASFRALGLPGAAALAVVVPVVEAVVAVLLVLWPAVGSWAAVALLGGFTVVIGRALIRGVDAGCACFGAGSAARRVSGLDLVRNAVLAALAVLATAAPSGVVL